MTSLTHLDLTYVLYTGDSHLSFLLALVTLLPFAILSGYVTLVYFNRDAVILNAFAGQLVNEALNWLLKRIFKQPRTGYGMPSSHAQFVAYTAIFITFHQIQRNGYPGMESKLAFLVAIMIAYSRHHLSYHTTTQIIVGFVIGMVFGAVYFTLTELSCTLRFSKKTLIGKICWLLRQTRSLIVNNLSLNDQTLAARGN
ncbi:hypothetical protein E3Q12_00016 [Wallemia mellicola]|nr:hypothetical protein E3Q12_00016 [Wallemia mellicola]